MFAIETQRIRTRGKWLALTTIKSRADALNYASDAALELKRFVRVVRYQPTFEVIQEYGAPHWQPEKQ